jgi:hypothetical protein
MLATHATRLVIGNFPRVEILAGFASCIRVKLTALGVATGVPPRA